MTGQLFVVPADAPEDPYIRLVLELADGRELRFRDIRKFGQGRAVRARPGHRRAGDRGRRRRRLRGDRAGAARSRLHASATSGDGSGDGRAGSSRSSSTSRSSPASATSTRTRRCGRRGCTRCGPPARCGPPDERRLYERSARSSPRPSSAAAPPSTTTPRPTATARCRSTSRSTSGPASRARAAADRSSAIVVGARSTHFCSWCQRLPAGDRAGARTILRTMTGGRRQRGRRWTELAGEGSLGATPDESRPPREAGPSERSEPPRPVARPPARRREPAPGPPDVDPAVREVTREVGAFVILDAHRGRHRGRRPHRSRRSQRRRARRRCCASPPAATSRTVARSSASAASRSACSRRRPTSTRSFMAAPDLRDGGASRGVASRADGRGPREFEHDGRSPTPRTPTSSTSSTSSAGTRSTSASIRR